MAYEDKFRLQLWIMKKKTLVKGPENVFDLCLDE